MAMAGPSVVQALAEESTCPVCRGDFQDPVITDCGHHFCRDCLAQCWAVGPPPPGETAPCPTCRTQVARVLTPNRQLVNVLGLAKKLNLQGEGSEEDGGVCAEHQLPLKFFSKEAKILLCAVCKGFPGYQEHHVLPLEEASEHCKELLRNHIEIVKKETTILLNNKADLGDKCNVMVKQAKAELKESRQEFGETHALLEEQEKQLEADVAEMEGKVVATREATLGSLSRNLCSLQSLWQEMEQKLRQPPGEFLQGIGGILERFERRESILNFSIDMVDDLMGICDSNFFLRMQMKQFRDVVLRDGESIVFEMVTLDPDTAHAQLIMSEDRTSVRREEGGSQDVTSNPERFSEKHYVLGLVSCPEGITKGRCTWGVTFEGEGFGAVGVARKSLRRKGNVPFNTDSGIWAVGRWPEGWRASDRPGQYFPPPHKASRKIHIYVNYEGGDVAFFDGDVSVRVYTFSGASFGGEAVRPFFYVGKKSSLRIFEF